MNKDRNPSHRVRVIRAPKGKVITSYPIETGGKNYGRAYFENEIPIGKVKYYEINNHR